MTNQAVIIKPSKDEKKVFTQCIVEMRKRQNLTQQQLADMLGVPQSFVSRYETGNRKLSFLEVCTIAETSGMGMKKFTKYFTDQMAKAKK